MLMFMLPMTARMYHSNVGVQSGSRRAAPWSLARFSMWLAMSGSCSVHGPRARVLWRLAVLLVLVALAALVLSGAIDPLQSGVLTMVPALALSFMMLARPYPGERAIARLRGRRLPQRSAADAIVGRPLRRRAHVVRGGRLIAVALAGRAPPLALAGCH
jgi:hypothetical protein